MTNEWAAICPDISCEGCANSIKRTLGKLEGVQGVEVTVAEKRVLVRYNADAVNAEQVQSRLEQAGFPAQN
jgi:Cu+-exporting ATPase